MSKENMKKQCLTGTFLQPLKTRGIDYSNFNWNSLLGKAFNGIQINHVAIVGENLEVSYFTDNPEMIERIRPPQPVICGVGALA